MTLCLTIVAHDVDDALQICGHGMFRNISGPGLPSGSHTLLRDDRLLTDWAAIIKASQLPETVRMDGVSTGQILWRLS